MTAYGEFSMAIDSRLARSAQQHPSPHTIAADQHPASIVKVHDRVRREQDREWRNHDRDVGAKRDEAGRSIAM